MAVLLPALLAGGCGTLPSSGRSGLISPELCEVYIPAVPDFPKKSLCDGATATCNMLAHWGLSATLKETRQAIGQGLLGFGIETEMMMHMEAQGLWAYAHYGTIEELKTRLRSGIPVLVGLEHRSFDERWFSVVVGFDDAHRKFVCHNGVNRAILVDYDDFARKWARVKRWMMTACPAQKAAWTLSGPELAHRSRFFERRGEYELALQDLDALRCLYPDSASVLVSQGVVRMKKGETEKAEALFREALVLEPDHTRACNNLAYLLADRGRNLDEAADLATKAAACEPDNPSTLDTLGYVQLQRGEFEGAARALQMARDRATGLSLESRSQINLRLALAHFQGGDVTKARLILREVRQADPRAQIPDQLQTLIGGSAASAL